MFTAKDKEQLQQRGISQELLEQQIENFENGFPFLPLDRAATVGDGIISLQEEDFSRYIADFEKRLDQLEVLKFVPASGAASRMFKELFALLVAIEDGTEGDPGSHRFFEQLEDFAFVDDLNDALGGPGKLKEALAAGEYAKILRTVLESPGLGYGQLPKGLLKFHQYEDGARTPVEEHLTEAVNYCAKEGGTAKIHFTVSPEHMEKFKAKVEEVLPGYEEQNGIKVEVTYSVQKPSTDTVAVDLQNEPFREEDGTMLFRPGGHGALLENLNDLEADVVFIKNIDNIVPDRLKEPTFQYKKALAGILLDLQEKVFAWEKKSAGGLNGQTRSELEAFVEKELCVEAPDGYRDWDNAQKDEYLRRKLHRPIRVCGMVKNEGEPGGGPFWAKNADGSVSLQIVETAQIDTSDPGQKDIMQHATHFNPVDLVCATRDREGNLYDLHEFRDPQTGFISEKSKGGKALKAQELPGLWNGAMADWTTLFVEVPIVTFNPVKTVFDLLRPQHQPG